MGTVVKMTESGFCLSLWKPAKRELETVNSGSCIWQGFGCFQAGFKTRERFKAAWEGGLPIKAGTVNSPLPLARLLIDRKPPRPKFGL